MQLGLTLINVPILQTHQLKTLKQINVKSGKTSNYKANKAKKKYYSNIFQYKI